MSKNLDPKCKQCRREGIKLYLKGERCYTNKCAMVKRNYAPGLHGIKGRKRLSDYGLQLREKQKSKRIYNILEKQFKNYYLKANRQKGDVGENLLSLLERRLDNTIFRLGLANSRAQARQIVNHGHILVNKRKVNIPSYLVKKNDIINLSKRSLEKNYFKQTIKSIKKEKIPKWLFLDEREIKAKVVDFPKKDDADQNIDTRLIIEYYSK